MRIKLSILMLTAILSNFGCGKSTSESSTGPATGAEEEKEKEDDKSDDAEDGDNGAPENSAGTDKPLLKSCYKGDSFACAVEAVIVRETNGVRGSRQALVHDFESSFVARDWSQKQASDGSISHDGFPYERKKVLIADFPNAKWSFFAENVGMFGGQDSDAEVVGKKFVAMWKGSPGHFNNMIGNYTYIGVGVARVGNSIYATQVFH